MITFRKSDPIRGDRRVVNAIPGGLEWPAWQERRGRFRPGVSYSDTIQGRVHVATRTRQILHWASRRVQAEESGWRLGSLGEYVSGSGSGSEGGDVRVSQTTSRGREPGAAQLRLEDASVGYSLGISS